MVCPATEIVIVPAHRQVQVSLFSSAGRRPIVTMSEPGIQGAWMLGTHGIGVSTPLAADVADATVGLLSDWHVPNVGMFVIL